MSDYIKLVDYARKDGLPSGSADKIVSGTELNSEFVAIQAAVVTKADKGSPTFTGTTTLQNLVVTGTVTGTIDGGTY